MRDPLRLPLAVVSVLLLAGCSGSGGLDGAALPTSRSEPSASDGPAPSATSAGDPGSEPSPAPTQPSSNVKVDPNQTFEGSAHKHDWWGADTQVVIMDKDIRTGPGGVCAGYTTLPACYQGETLIRFDSSPDHNVRPGNVFPGTGKMEIKVTVGQILHPFDLGVGWPGSFAVQTRFKVDQAQETFTIENINESVTDPPHFRSSNWFLQLLTSQGSAPHPASLYRGPLHLQVTIFRDLTRELPVDPPHPDLWGDLTRRTLFDAKAAVDITKTPAASRYSQAGVPALAENSTVLLGTSKMTVTMTWTNEYPDISKPRLIFCPANGNCGYGNQVLVEPPLTSETGTKRVYEFEVRPDWWDSPYASKSRWSFSWRFEDASGQGYGNLKGNIHWLIEIQK